MKFIVTAKTEHGTYSYDAIGESSFDIHAAAIDRFGVCAISVRAK